MRHRLVASLSAALVLALAAFAGTSLAGNGHGNGGGGDHGQWSSGQQQSQDQSQYQSQSSHDSHGNGSWSKQSDTSPSSPAASGDNSQGVKPSSSTKHDTYARASSGETKQYGNGQTAGQIATKAGYGNATLHGPGNSQPHKTMCGGHEVDVHALKAHGSSCGSSEQQQHGVSGVQKTEVKKTEEQPAPAPAPAPAPSPAPSETESQSQGVSTWAHEHVTICHATGSTTNPYVRISPSAAGVFHGHLGHQDGRDIVPPFVWNGQTYSENWDANGQAIWNAGCAVAASAATPAPAAPPTASSSKVEAQAVAVATTPAPTTPAPSVVPSATVTPTTKAPATPAVTAGAVKGATVTLTPKTTRTAAAPVKAKPQGGVLGTTTRLGNAVAGTRLPFTGLPLWIFAAAAAAVILVGAGVRRSARDRA